MGIGRPRAKNRPNNIALQRRCMRAMEGTPTVRKRKDIMTYIKALKTKFVRYGKIHKGTDNSIKHREDQLVEFDFKFGKKKAVNNLKRLELTGTHKEQLQQVIALLKQDKTVEGFTLVRTCKADGNPTVIRMLDIEDEMSLCVFVKPKPHKGNDNIGVANKKAADEAEKARLKQKAGK